VGTEEALAEGVERAGANVAVDDTERPHGEAEEAARAYRCFFRVF
jgi:hypothetical protein